MTTVICAVDGSTESATALEAASHIAQRSGTSLLVVNVQPAGSATDRAQRLDVAHGVASEQLLHLAEIEHATVVPLVGDPATELATLALDARATMIVIGARGKGRARTTFRSRLHRELADVAPVPVVIAASTPAELASTPPLVVGAEISEEAPRTKRSRRPVRRWADETSGVRPRPTTR
jgi:nucleotide-binding universal stress UspA family protein